MEMESYPRIGPHKHAKWPKRGEHPKPYPNKQSTIAVAIAMSSLQSNLEGDDQRVRWRTSGVLRNLRFGSRICDHVEESDGAGQIVAGICLAEERCEHSRNAFGSQCVVVVVA